MARHLLKLRVKNKYQVVIAQAVSRHNQRRKQTNKTNNLINTHTQTHTHIYYTCIYVCLCMNTYKNIILFYLFSSFNCSYHVCEFEYSCISIYFCLYTSLIRFLNTVVISIKCDVFLP